MARDTAHASRCYEWCCFSFTYFLPPPPLGGLWILQNCLDGHEYLGVIKAAWHMDTIIVDFPPPLLTESC